MLNDLRESEAIRMETTRLLPMLLQEYREGARHDGEEPLRQRLATAGTLSSRSGISILTIKTTRSTRYAQQAFGRKRTGVLPPSDDAHKSRVGQELIG